MSSPAVPSSRLLAGGAGGIYRVQLLQQGADGSEAGQKKLGEVLPSMKMRLQAKKK